MNLPKPLRAVKALRWPLLLLAAVFMSPANAGKALDQLNAFIANVDTFQANFEQTLYDSDSEPLRKSIGNIRIKRPGRFVWNYFSPEEQQIVADGRRVWMYDKDLEQVTVNSIDDRVAGTPLVLLMRAAPLTDTFDVQELGESDGIQWIELTKPESSFPIVCSNLLCRTASM